MSHKTLFLQQSYEDCTRQYMELLEKQKMPLWDYVILTASNESQAQSYRMQIQYRLIMECCQSLFIMQFFQIQMGKEWEAAALH